MKSYLWTITKETDMPSRNNANVVIALGLMVIVTLLIGAVIGGAVGYVIASNLLPASAAIAVQPTASIAPIPATLEEINQQSVVITDQSSSVEAVKKVLPAVVTIINQGFQGSGSGSGFFISTDGYLATNNHVVESAQELLVIYAQGDRVPARLVGTAPDFDLAVLKVDGLAPAVVAWGDSSELPLGAHVIAIGSALGEYRNTVTAGVLSGFNRELGPLRGLLQTDAAINSGNSGGPLINLAGQIVGVNTAVVRGQPFSSSAGAEGLGFAIPSNVARVVVQRLIESGEVRPSYLGVEYRELNPQVAVEQNLAITQGALLQQIVSGSPADQAGLRLGDIILAVNNQRIDDRHPLISLLIEHVAGETITLEILRDGNTFQTKLTLGERA
jgi:2-alkenal reductase